MQLLEMLGAQPWLQKDHVFARYRVKNLRKIGKHTFEGLYIPTMIPNLANELLVVQHGGRVDDGYIGFDNGPHLLVKL